MQSSGVRLMARRLTPLISFSRSQPVFHTACRYLRTPRAAGVSRLKPSSRTDLDSDDASIFASPAAAAKLISGKDWQEADEESRRGVRRPETTRWSAPDPLAPGTIDETAIDNSGEAADATDLLMEKIRRCGELDVILRLVERHEKIMNHHHLIRATEQVFDQIVKRDRLSDTQMNDLRHDPRFATLCTRLIRSCRYMSPYAALEVLKLLSVVKAPTDSRIAQTYLHLLKESINELSLSGLMYASYLLPRFSPNRVAEALLIAIPIAFDMRMEKEMDPDDLGQLVRIAMFCACSSVSKRTRESAMQSLRRGLARNDRKNALSLPDAVMLLMRLERSNVHDAAVYEFIFNAIDRGDLAKLRYATTRKLLESLRYMRAKRPADFAPDHRIFALEKRIASILPNFSDSSSVSSGAFFDDTTAIEDVLSSKHNRDR